MQKQKDPRQAQLEQALERYIALLDAEIAAYSPSWVVPALQQSYAEASAQAAVCSVWDQAIINQLIAQQQARAFKAYGDDKIQHLYP
jgi:hypothetical protein